MNDVTPRYEYRAFAPDLGIVEEHMRRFSELEKYRESLEIYILSSANDENNTKIRGGLMDIKVLINRHRGLEQWSPRMKGGFPLSAKTITEEVFPAFGVSAPALQRDSYTLGQYLNEIVQPHPDLSAASVFKKRYGFVLQNCFAEFAVVYVNGAMIDTACVESEDPQAVLAAGEAVHLNQYENVNYLLALKRVIGMAPLPQGAFYKAF